MIAKVAGEMAAYGLEPRHLRAFRTAAEREVGLVEQVVSPIRRSREDGAEGRAAQTMDEMAVLSIRLHAALVKSGLRSLRLSGTQWAPCRLSTTTPTMIRVSASTLVRSHDSPSSTTPTTAIAAVPSPAQIA